MPRPTNKDELLSLSTENLNKLFGFVNSLPEEYKIKIFEKYKGTELQKSIHWLLKSHEEIMKLIAKHTDEELFTKKKCLWTGTTSLGAYFISATSSHYDWALKTIKPLKKMFDKK